MFKFAINGKKGSKNILISIGLTFIIISLLAFSYPKFFAFVFAGIMGLLGIGALLRGVSSKPPKQGNNPFGGYENKTEDSSYKEVDD